ncbi:MAG: class II fructose-bisphosphate aldolase [Bacillota bacterium]
MIINNVEQVRRIYIEAAARKWVLPCFCTENLTTTEAILSAAQEFGLENDITNVPIIVAITCNYDHRSQAKFYTHTRDSKTGMRLFLNDVKALAAEGGYFENLDVMIHLDHIQFDNDTELLESDLSEYSSIMFDASALPLEENIRRTAEFVRNNSGKILIEGACDEIVDATGSVHNELTTPENALRFAQATGVDLVVANLGTEHRASGKELKYHGEVARKLREGIGAKIVLHGTSSVPNDQIGDLFNDGVCKVNIWTALERDSVPKLFEEMIKNSEKIVGEKPELSHFTTVYRQDIIYNEMKKVVREYLNLWYRRQT